MKNSYYFILLLLFSCNTYSTEYSIQYFTNEIEINRNEYIYINEKIKTLNYEYPYNLTGYRRKQIFYVVKNNGKSIKLSDKEFGNFLWHFVRKQYLGIRIYEDAIRYSYSHKRNKNFSGYHILYFKEQNLKTNIYFQDLMNQGYKFYNKGDIPKETDGWIYDLEDNWYLQSPFPK